MSRTTWARTSTRKLRSPFMASAASIALLSSFASAKAQDDSFASGFYLGANVAYGESHSEEPTYGEWEGEGWAGGIEAGYNMTLSGFVVGGEINAALVSIDGQSDPIFGGKTLKDRLDISGSLRLRAGLPLDGVPLFDQALIYGTGGVAVGKWSLRYLPTAGASDEDAKLRYGWTYGGGIEVPAGANVSVKLEYLRTDYNDKTYNLTAGPYRVDSTEDTVRLGLIWHFSD